MAVYDIKLPIEGDILLKLRAGDMASLTGDIYTARDAAHKRMIACLDANQPLPFDVKNQALYYVGPAPASPGHAVGSAGPTTSYRMDAYTPPLLKAGLKAMIGKGKRADAVVRAMKEHGCVYFGAVGGAAALIARRIESSEVVAYEDLGAEAIHKFRVRDFRVIVLIDSQGNNLYELGPQKYRSDN